MSEASRPERSDGISPLNHFLLLAEGKKDKVERLLFLGDLPFLSLGDHAFASRARRVHQMSQSDIA